MEPLLLEVADVVNTTLDLETTLRRVAELVRKVIDYEIFAILLLNEQRQELYVRFRLAIRPKLPSVYESKSARELQAVRRRPARPVLVADVTLQDFYIEALPNVKSELAIPLIVKNRADRRHRPGSAGKRLLHRRAQAGADADRLAHGRRHRKRAAAYAITRQARTLALLNEIARELTSILNLDELLKRVAEMLNA